MNKKQVDSHIFKGMQMDLADSKHPSEYLKYAYNIRITARENSSLLSITNDRDMTIIKQVSGIYLGHCLIRQYLVVFLYNQGDSNIIRYDLSKDPIESVLLYSGDLGFNKDYPIECVGSYENDSVIKVYWTDGLNQPRMVNIMKPSSSYNDKSFDFCREIQLNDKIYVTKSASSLGNFPSGVIQYAFTYYDRYAQESNIFNVTPLYYISYNDRGASPEDKVNISFDITISNYDESWDYIRVYSILRTSINGTPTVKRVIDIPIDSSSSQVKFTDNNTTGDYIDPTELLYKGGESITASTICSKDNTLFLGNITLNKSSLNKKINNLPSQPYGIDESYRNIYIKGNNYGSNSYNYFNQLTSYDSTSFNNLVPCGYFKGGNNYRIGLQFQYKDGSWSNPIYVGNYTVSTTYTPSYEYSSGGSYYKISLPVLRIQMSNDLIELALSEGYKRVRPVMAMTDYGTRNVLAQGIINPVIAHGPTITSSPNKYQASWFFRPEVPSGSDLSVSCPGINGNFIGSTYFNNIKSFMENGVNIRRLEMYGIHDELFAVNYGPYTFNSPEIDFSDYIKSLDMTDTYLRKRGEATYIGCLSAIDIQTDSPTIDADGKGAIHREAMSNSSAGIISGLYYDDNLVDDLTENTFGSYPNFDYCARWMVFLWHKSGSLNNDIDRANFSGTRSAVLKKKVVSNLRYAYTYFFNVGNAVNGTFVYIDSNETESTKVGSSIYNANVNTVFNFSTTPYIFAQTNTSPQTLQSNNWCYFSYQKPSEETSDNKLFRFKNNTWEENSIVVGDKIKDLAKASGLVRMKYKSTPHIICDTDSAITATQLTDAMPIVELCRPFKTGNELYGNTTSNIWIPCGNITSLNGGSNYVICKYGDTYFQRWDCLKTYPYTKEDENQVVEIGSFMLESYVNIDGRYDRNRGLINNINISPTNFNLFNNIYSQVDNFFNYRILPSDIYDDISDLTSFSNQITWSLQKANGADIDEWTRITLSSVYDLEGSHGAVNKLCTHKNNIFCFQDRAISNVLFNSRVQIPSSDGLPIEISNNYKVDGVRYITDSIGCNNKFTISVTPSGIYFIDTISNHLYQIGENINDVSLSKNMTSWFSGETINKTLYDTKNNDLYIFSSGTEYSKELCFSDILGEFVSEMDIYNNVAFIESYGDNVFAGRNQGGVFLLSTMFTGDYQPWRIEFISNGSPQGTAGMDKVFTNLEYRMDMYDSNNVLLNDNSFNSIQVWNEYQDTGVVNMSYVKDKPSILKKKFRVWRIDIPRSALNKRDRIRNTWCHVKLWSTNYNKAILHDISMIYYV